ncbi:acyclic terpene utilization AtuA family protein [Bryobacter aggregatus]|uniref:acyclic terpene utilization AtuA family protein n=1 Tax=Bryobacter aggregatus TaxID=360054 RepID=UPI0004E173E9|nr:acyclic terpene utilization AtuA family protein [Bryobacter aggregatus]
MIRIGCGQGFWGDSAEAPVRLVEDGPLDYLVLDYLAEVTMSILQKQKKENPAFGYARDFPPLIERIAATIQTKGIRVIANAGGVNPKACAEEIRRRCPQLKVAVVLGDDILSDLPSLIAGGHPLLNMDTGEPLASVLDQVLSANAYLGAYPLAEALASGVDVVVSGRCADAALVLAPMLHAYHWPDTNWPRLSAGIVAGHIVECGAQCTGGNCLADWQSIPDLANIGYPIVEAHSNGHMVITKHEGSGGRVSLASVKEQLVYEVGDPSAYYTPDVIADFTTVQLHDDGPNRVAVSGASAHGRPTHLKASIAYHWGFKAAGTLTYGPPQAALKARTAAEIVNTRCRNLGLSFDKQVTEVFGDDWAMLRMAVRDRSKANVDRWTREMIPLVLNGPPGATGYGDGRPKVHQVVAYWPALLPREKVTPRIEVLA